ncbi:MAG: DNA polymerase III subunit chi [Gemmatimonadaceae bacterium]|nr:DNA polymerase III subunit chi [Acetobacteraceae bacterium]
MTEVGFYHLTRTGPDQALPALLGRTLAANERAVVRAGDEARVAVLDAALWASQDPDWLPHGTARTGHAALQPIWLTSTGENPNGARFLFVLDGQDSSDLLAWARVFDLFDGRDDAAVAAARTRWSAAKALGATLTYWQQTERGWTKKA